MVTTVLSDFSRVLLFPKDPNYPGTLNGLYTELKSKYGSFNFYDYYVFNDELLDFYTKLKEKYSVNIFTTGLIQKNSPEVAARMTPIFENTFAAQDYGLSKQDPQSYVFIADKLGKNPEEILFIDDQKGNIEAAQKAGMQAILYISNENLFSYDLFKERNSLVR